MVKPSDRNSLAWFFVKIGVTMPLSHPTGALECHLRRRFSRVVAAGLPASVGVESEEHHCKSEGTKTNHS